MSHVRLDDQHGHGRLTQFRERLSAEVRMQTGEEFPIFQAVGSRGCPRAGTPRLSQAMRFPESGTFAVPQALEPAMIARELDRGRYVEPNVWMCHAIDADRAAAATDS